MFYGEYLRTPLVWDGKDKYKEKTIYTVEAFTVHKNNFFAVRNMLLMCFSLLLKTK